MSIILLDCLKINNYWAKKNNLTETCRTKIVSLVLRSNLKNGTARKNIKNIFRAFF